MTCPDNVDAEPGSFGWCDEDTCSIIAAGIPDEKIKDADKKRVDALKRAINLAQMDLRKRFEDDNFPRVMAMPEYPEPMKAMFAREDANMKKFTEIVETGHATSIRYDDNLICCIVYRVSYPKLRKFYDSCKESL
jgi:hypothetical protein